MSCADALEHEAASTLGVLLEGLTIAGPNGEILAGPVDAEVKTGSIHVIAGPSGSGKTLVAQAIGGVLDHAVFTELGEISLDGDVVFVGSDPHQQILTTRVDDEIAFALEMMQLPAPQIRERIHWALQHTGLTSCRYRDPWTLSGGQQQRLILATALVRDAKILILDAPSFSLDPDGIAECGRLLREAAERGTTIVVCDDDPRVTEWADSRSHLGNPDEPAIDVPPRPKKVASNDLPLLRVQDLHLRPARLCGAALTLHAGHIHALMGDNGSGKSSLMAVLGGAARPTSGSFSVDGQMLKRLPDGMVAWSQQNPERQFGSTTVRAEIDRALAASDANGPLSAAERIHLTESLGLSELLETSPYDLTSSQAKRLGILLSALSNRRLLMLDEPTAHQDAQGRAQLAALARAYADGGGCVLLSCHDTAFATAVADHIHVMSEGLLEAGERPVPRRPAAESAQVMRPRQTCINPLTAVMMGLALIAMGFLLPVWYGRLSLAAICLIAAAIVQRRPRLFIRQLLLTVLAGLVFGALAWRGNAASETPLHAMTLHAALGALVVSVSVLVSALTSVQQLADALVQRCKVPYQWCTLAVTGVTISHYLRQNAPLIAAAIRLRDSRNGRLVHRIWLRMSSPVRAGIPLLVEAVRFADGIEMTLQTRGFGRHATRTFRDLYPWRKGDALVGALLLMAALATGLLIFRFH